ncbi:MAG TPA: ABC transporter ATP-binding protein [Candidatus Limnocylindrales bacterium]|nr:ABC transporter ATP-binding protein [Candidatus Limnocylindrales bacterium]
MIVVENLTKYYGTLPAIQGVSFRVEKGEILGFLGPNGAGKTTTMRILTGFMPATSGTATVAGYDVFKDSLEVRKRIGYLPENVPIYNDMEVWAYLNFVTEVKGVPKKLRKEKIQQVIKSCGLESVSNRLIKNLSKGYRQRVGLAQALVNDPEVLILDEPTMGLDPKQITDIRHLIKELATEKTIILSSHILPEVSMICQRVVIINQGKVVAEDTTENLTSRSQTSRRILLQVDGPSEAVLKILKEVNGVNRVQRKDQVTGNIFNYEVEASKDRDVRRDLAHAIVQSGNGLLELRPVEISLEDVFVKLVTEEEG